MSARVFIAAYIVSAAIQLLSIVTEWKLAHDVSKVVLLPLLAGFYLQSVNPRSTAFLAGLIFCWLGDILLMFNGFFILGLVAFLMGHIMYIFSYRQHQWEDRSQELLVTQKIRFSLPVALTGTGLVVVLFPGLGGLQIPVLLYAIVITVMVMTALFRYGRTVTQSFWLVFSGAVLFMTSDAILALNKFLSPLPSAEFWIMLTYMSAQGMIVLGIVRHRESAS